MLSHLREMQLQDCSRVLWRDACSGLHGPLHNQLPSHFLKGFSDQESASHSAVAPKLATSRVAQELSCEPHFEAHEEWGG